MDESDRLDLADGRNLYIVDLSTHAAALESAIQGSNSSCPPAAIIATAAQWDALSLKSSIDSDLVVAKPVQRDALLAALRLAAGDRSGTSGANHAARSRPIIGGHVLLVEDEPVNAAVAQGYLAELGCTSVWVDNGLEAIARSAMERFDLVMMDLNMPGMDGFAATQLIRGRQGASSHAPIIALTAHDAKNYRDSCLAAGMNDLMSKPYSLDQCEALLRQWIRGANAGPRVRSAHIEAAEIDAATVTGLKNLRGGGQSDLYSRLVALFQPASTQAVAELGSLLSAADHPAAAALCHRLASSAANVGALVFSRYVRQLEKSCDERDAVRASNLYDTVRAAHPPLIEELTRLQLKESA